MCPPADAAFVDCGLVCNILKWPAAAVIAAQMWCPIALSHFCTAVNESNGSSICGLMTLFLNTLSHLSTLQERGEEQHRWLMEYAKNSYEGGFFLNFSPQALGIRMGVLSSKRTHGAKDVYFGQPQSIYWMSKQEAPFKKLLECLPNSWSSDLADCDYESARARHVHICNALVRLEKSAEWFGVGEQSGYIRLHIQRNMWMLLVKKHRVCEAHHKWKKTQTKMSDMLEIFPDVKGVLEAVPKSWSANMGRFAQMSKHIPVSMHFRWTCLFGYATNPTHKQFCSFL